MNSKRKQRGESSGGIGVIGLLGVVFIVLKLGGWTEVANWSWWWVLAPFWVSAVLFLVFVFVVVGVFRRKQL